MPEKFSNFGLTTLAGNIGSSDTTITVASGTNLPLLDFYITIDTEVIYVGARSGTSLTGCVRGQKSTAAASHSLGATVYHGALAHHLDELYAMGDANVSCSVYRLSAQTVTTATEPAISFEGADHDTDNMWSSGSATRITIRRTGKYLVWGDLTWVNSTVGRRIATIWKNGGYGVGLGLARQESSPSGSGEASHSLSAVVNLTAGDYVELAAYQTSGGNLNVATGVASYSARFGAVMVSGGAQPNTPSARIYRGTAQSITGGASGAYASFSDKRWDTDSMWDSGAPTRLTCKTAGKYVLNAHVHFNSVGTDGWREIYFRLNGSDNSIIAVDRRRVDTTAYQHLALSTVWDLKVGDYVELHIDTSHTVSTVVSSSTVPFGLEMGATMIPGGLARNTTPPAAISAKMRKTANQALSASTWTEAVWQTIDYDTGGMTGTANTMIIRQDGKYLLNAQMIYAPTGTAARRIIAFWNGTVGSGTELRRQDHVHVSTAEFETYTLSAVVDLKAGDVIKVGLWSANAVNAGSTQIFENSFECTLISGNAEGKPPGARVQRVASHNVANNTDLAISFDTMREDSDMMWSASLPTRLTVKTAGKYVIQASMNFSANATGQRQVTIVANGLAGRQIATQFTNTASSLGTEINCVGVADLKVGDYVEMFVWQNSGTTLTASVSGERSPVLSMALISAPTRGSQSPPNNVSARARKTGGISSVAAATWVKYPLDVTDFDTDNIVDLTNDRFVARTPGKYFIQLKVSWAITTAGRRIAALWKNGLGTGTEIARTDIPNLGNNVDQPTESVATIVDLNTGDYVEGGVYSASATSITADIVGGMEFVLVSGTVDPTAPGARVYREGTQSLSGGVWTAMSFTNEIFDSDMVWDAASPTRLTCRTAGKYTVQGAAYISGTTNSKAYGIRRNGTDFESILGPIPAGLDNSGVVSAVVDLKVGDYVEFMLQSNLAANAGWTNIISSGNQYAATFSAVMMAPAGMVTSTTAQIPRGVLGYAQITSNQNAINSEVDVTGLTVTVSVAAGRRIRISAQGGWTATNANNVQIAVNIKEGSTYIRSGDYLGGVAGNGLDWYNSVILTPTAGSHTYKITASRTVGTGDVQILATTTRPNWILVEDIGSA